MTTRGNGHTASETSKEVVRRWFEAMERHALDEAVACWTPDAVNHASGRYGSQLPRGSEALRRVFEALRLAFPDRRWAIDDMFADADRVVCRMTVSGTFGAPPTRPPEPVPPGWVGGREHSPRAAVRRGQAILGEAHPYLPCQRRVDRGALGGAGRSRSAAAVGRA